MADTQTIMIKLPLPGGKELKQCNNAEIAAAMNKEVDSFDQYMKRIEQGGLVPVERTLIKTYLSWKLIYEAAGNGNKD